MTCDLRSNICQWSDHASHHGVPCPASGGRSRGGRGGKRKREAKIAKIAKIVLNWREKKLTEATKVSSGGKKPCSSGHCTGLCIGPRCPGSQLKAKPILQS